MAELGLGSNTDPFQGYDIQVKSDNSSVMIGAFTSAMFKIVNQTETYLTLNNRVPRHLDGELIFIWAAEQGLVNPDVLGNAFGPEFAEAFASGVARSKKIPREARFNLEFKASVHASDVNPKFITSNEAGTPSTTRGGTAAINNSTYVFKVKNCRIDTHSFGVTSGRNIVAVSYQGTGEGLEYTVS